MLKKLNLFNKLYIVYKNLDFLSIKLFLPVENYSQTTKERRVSYELYKRRK